MKHHEVVVDFGRRGIVELFRRLKAAAERAFDRL
jgi:hypothetical protein